MGRDHVDPNKCRPKLRPPRPYPCSSQGACHRMEQYPMPFSRPLSALNGIATKSGASQLQPTMKQPMSRISSMRRDWNDKPQPSQNPQSKVNCCQDTDPFPGGKSTALEPKPKPGVPVKASTVSCTFSDKTLLSTAQWQIPGFSRLQDFGPTVGVGGFGASFHLGKIPSMRQGHTNLGGYCGNGASTGSRW